MSQESVNEAHNHPSQPNQSVEGMLVQLTQGVQNLSNELQNLRHEVGGIYTRLDHLEGAVSAPPNLGAPRPQREAPHPLGRDPPPRPPRQHYMPPPIPPFGEGRGGRGRGRNDPRARLREQERGAQNREPNGDDFEEDFGDYYGENEARRPATRTPTPRGHNHEEEDHDDHFENRYGPRRNPRPYNPRNDYYDEDGYYGDDNGHRRPPRHHHHRRGQYDEEDEFKDIKINIPTFSGSSNPEVYM